jgi:hypothetical protein
VTESQATLVIRERSSICLLLRVSGVVPKKSGSLGETSPINCILTLDTCDSPGCVETDVPPRDFRLDLGWMRDLATANVVLVTDLSIEAAHREGTESIVRPGRPAPENCEHAVVSHSGPHLPRLLVSDPWRREFERRKTPVGIRDSVGENRADYENHQDAQDDDDAPWPLPLHPCDDNPKSRQPLEIRRELMPELETLSLDPLRHGIAADRD